MSDSQEKQKTQRNKNKQILNQGIQGASLMGKTYAIIGAVIMTIIAISLILGGVMILHSPYTKYIQATVTKVSCHQISSNSDYMCDITFSYSIDNKKYEKNASYESYYEIQPNDLVNIYLNKNDYNDYKFVKIPKWIGIVFIILSVFVIFFTFLYLFFILRYKGLAVISGLKRVVTQ